MEVTYSNTMRSAFGNAVLSDIEAGKKLTPLHNSVIRCINQGRGLIRRKTMISVTRAR